MPVLITQRHYHSHNDVASMGMIDSISDSKAVLMCTVCCCTPLRTAATHCILHTTAITALLLKAYITAVPYCRSLTCIRQVSRRPCRCPSGWSIGWCVRWCIRWCVAWGVGVALICGCIGWCVAWRIGWCVAWRIGWSASGRSPGDRCSCSFTEAHRRSVYLPVPCRTDEAYVMSNDEGSDVSGDAELCSLPRQKQSGQGQTSKLHC